MKTLFKHQKSTFKRIFKKSKLLLSSIVFILIFALLFTYLPMDGIIALAEQIKEESKLITVVEELEQYRTEFSKTYLKSDGTLEAVVSANPIHYEQDGEWVEIDSTLEITENDDSKEVYQNKKGKFKVNLPTQLESGSEVEIENGDNKISIKLLENKKSKGKKNNDKKQKAEKLTKDQRKKMTAGELFEADNNQLSALEYTEAYSNTNLRYDVTPNEVKESIILQKAPNKKATYSYEITADGLTAVLNEDNSIDFFEGAKTEGAEPVFSMPAPHMFDSNDEYSYDIVTTLENKDGKYLLTYKPSYEWLKAKERAYPVTLDPTVTVNSGIQDSYTFSGEGYKDYYTGYEQQLKVGTTAWIAPNDYWQTYLKFTDLPQIPYEDYRIDSAYLMLTPKATTGNWQEMELGVYELTEDWKNHQTGKVAERLTFNNAPADVGYSTATASVARGGADNGVGVGFEIAHLVEKWYDSPETNFGIKLAAHLEASQYNDNLVFHSSRSTTGTAPYLSLTYTEFVPVERIEITGRPADDKLEVGYFMPVHSLKALVYPENATNKEVIWESSDENVGYMESYGLESYFNPVSLGTTTITAKSADNNEIIDSFDLEVYNIPITEIQIMALPDNNTLIAGKKHELSLLPLPYEATDHSVFSSNWAIWTSSDETVASVNNGTITTYKQGTTVVTATYGELTDSFTLTVTEVPLTSVALENETSAIEIGDIYYLNTVVSPQNASDKRATATSSAPEVATIECITSPTNYSEAPTFKITALSEGEVTFTIQFLDDPTKVLTTSMYVIYIDHSINIIKPENDTINAYEVWQLTDTEDVTITAPSEIGLLGDGKIVAYEPGNYTIILSNGIESVMYEIRVGAEMTITGLPENNTIKIGERYEDLQIEFDFPQFGDIEWSSSDENIAEIYYDYVRARVVLIGKGEGAVSIEARMLGTSFNAVQQIEVIPQPVEKVKLFTSNLVNGNTIYLGQRYTINSKVYPLDSPCATFDRVNYTDTNNLLIFTDTELRLITYVTAKTENIQKEAKTQIYAEAGGVYSEPKTVTVKAPKATIKNRPTNDTIYKNGTRTLSYESDPETGVTIRWYSSNSSIAKIDEQTGKIEAKSVGSVTISIKVKYGDYSEITDSFTLYVSNANLFISGDGGDDKEILTVGETKQLTAEVVAGENASQEVEWISDTPSVATVDSNGLVTAHAPGEVIISAKSKQYNYAIDTAYFEVVPKASKIIIENPPTNALEVNKEYSLKVSVEPSNTIDKEVVFSSNNADIYINPNTGKISVLGAGKAVITVKLKSDSSISATCHIEGMYSYGFSVQNAYPFLNCEMHTLGFNGNYESFDNYANNVNSQFTNFMIKKFDYRGKNSFAFDLKNKKYFGTVVDRPNIDDVDLMIYTGHGYAKNRDKSEGLFQYNSIHYGHHGTPGNVISHNLGEGTNAEDNFTTKDAMHFGQETKSKWLLAYTCNFLNTKQGDPYVNSLLNNGGRLIMGMGTKSYVVPDEGTMFSNLLKQGKTFQHAFREAGKRYQNLGSDPEKNNRSAKKYRIAYYGPYGKGTLNDTIIGSLSAIEKTETKMFEQIINKYDFNEFEEY